MPLNRRRRLVLPSSLLVPRVSRKRGKKSRASSLLSFSANKSAVSNNSDPSDSQPLAQTSSYPSLITSDNLTITLPVPPSINHQYASVNGRRVLSSTGRAYKALVGQLIWLALTRSPSTHSLRNRLQVGPLAFSIRFFFATSLRRDLDGGLKIAQDAVCEGLGVNDNRIIETHLYKHVDKADPRIEVSLSCLPPSSSSV